MNAIEVIQRANKAWNANDADAVAATYVEGATYSNSRTGHDPIGTAIVNYAKGAAAYPDASVELVTSGDTGRRLVANQWVMRGTNNCTLPDGTPASTVALAGTSLTQNPARRQPERGI